MIAQARFDACPACSGDELTFVEEIRGFEIERCSRCGLEFTANPRGGTSSESDRPGAGASAISLSKKENHGS